MADYDWLQADLEAKKKFTKKDVKKINQIKFVFQNVDGYDECMVFDLAEGKAYWGSNINDSWDDRTKTVSEISLTEEQIQEIKGLMGTVYDWEPNYRGYTTNLNGNTYSWWHLTYALEDGRIYSNSGYDCNYLGNSIRNMPDGFYFLMREFETYWACPEE